MMPKVRHVCHFATSGEYFHHWLLAEYVWKRHSGINRVLGRVWQDSLRHWKPRRPNKIEDLDLILSR
jgi:hypothetical protein